MGLAVLQQLPVFGTAKPPTLERLLEQSRIQFLPRGSKLLHSGKPASLVFVLLSGSARSHLLTPQARELTLERHQPPDLLGAEAVFGAAQHLEVSMLEDGEVLVLSAQALRQAAQADIGLCHALLEWMATKHNAFTWRIGELFYADLGARLARLLLAQPAGWQLPPNSLLAAELGTVPELVSRKLGEFYRAGLIRLEKRHVFVVDQLGLQSMLTKVA
jgi:CRP/FNR family transcriptional regulator, dissimilatory nitrate respiration regulator